MKSFYLCSAFLFLSLCNLGASEAVSNSTQEQNVDSRHRLVPQDLQTASKTAKKGDILVYDGISTWYKVEEKTSAVVEAPVALEVPTQQQPVQEVVAAAPAQQEIAAAPEAPAQAPQKKKTVVKVLIPQKDLESTIRGAKKGDVIIYDGSSKWYKIEGQNLKSGTRVYVLGEESVME